MTQARIRIDPTIAALPRSEWERLIYEANLGKEGSELARRYYIDKECQIDIAVDMYTDRSTVSRKLGKTKNRIEETYRRLKQ